MAVTLGKRKRHAAEIETDSGSASGDENARAFFQRAFEAKFKPLEKTTKPLKAPEEVETEYSDREVEDSDWSGLSDDEKPVQIVEHGAAGNADVGNDRGEMKAFMSSRPPSSQRKASHAVKQIEQTPEDNAAEGANLKHDLALQRLLKESHLLDRSTANRSTAVPEGKDRIKALDLRLHDLGAKKAVSEQKNMPLAHRKGIVAKATNREASRRKEAAENGIVLEKARLAAKPEKRRERSVSTPTVGKFQSGTLKLSSRDVRSIEGPRQRAGGKGRR